MPAPVRINVFIIDYMALVRKVLREMFKASATIHIVATASNALLARPKILTTLAQDASTSVVFGMPKEAYQRGGAEKLVPLQDIVKHLAAIVTAWVPGCR